MYKQSDGMVAVLTTYDGMISAEPFVTGISCVSEQLRRSRPQWRNEGKYFGALSTTWLMHVNNYRWNSAGIHGIRINGSKVVRFKQLQLCGYHFIRPMAGALVILPPIHTFRGVSDTG